jgi:DNA-binding MarR family transcriptional regulator
MRPVKPTRSEHVGLLVGRFRRLITGAVTRRLEREGRSIHEYRVLAELGRGGPRAQADLAVATAQHPAAISRLVDELESAALVRRRRAVADRRQVIVELTPAGRARYKAERPYVRAAIDDVLAPLSPRAQHRLAELLERVVAAHERPAARKRAARR